MAVHQLSGCIELIQQMPIVIDANSLRVGAASVKLGLDIPPSDSDQDIHMAIILMKHFVYPSQ